MIYRREFLGLLAGAPLAGIFPPDKPIMSEAEKWEWQAAIIEASSAVSREFGHDHFFCEWYESLR